MKTNENNPSWKGDNAKEKSIREWLHIHKKKPLYCELCRIGTPKDLFSLKDTPVRNPNNWIYICRSCNKKIHPWKNQYGKEVELGEDIEMQLGLKRYERMSKYHKEYYKKHKTKLNKKSKEYEKKNKEFLKIRRKVKREGLFKIPYVMKKIETFI